MSRNPLAIVGLAGLFPGASNVDELWRHILAARPASTVSLAHRWGEPVPAMGREIACDQAACLPEACLGSSAEGDRQLRAGRHVVAAALEHAGAPSSAEAPTALVCGTSWSGESFFEADAQRCVAGDSQARGLAPEEQLAQLAPPSLIDGPRVAVDAACASSLFAIDVAAGLLACGCAHRVVVVGLNATLPAFMSAGFSQLGVLSPVGTTLPLAHDAQGFVPGESAAAIVVEPLSQARGSGRTILAVVRALGLSADGADRSIFAPSERGQRLAYERAYEQLDDDRRAAPVDYIEAHGTATTLGDAVEIKSLRDFFGPRLGEGRTLPVGSVKGIVGHTLAAAGMVSVIKAILMLRHGLIPPHLPVAPHPDLEDSGLTLPTTAIPLRSATGDRPRIGVSSFGFGGANAHLVLEGTADEAGAGRGATADETPGVPGCSQWAKPPTLAIVDLELALGSHLETADCEELLRPVRPSARTRREPDPERFCCLSDQDRQTLGPGSYFPAGVTIDAAGLRLGPKLLARQDPLQLLLVELAHRLVQRQVQRQEELAHTPGGGAVVTANFGGQTALAQRRRWAALARGLDGETFAPPNTLEAIGASLSSMCSGYLAYHFDFRGLHVTLAGLPGTFFTTLLLAPYWFGQGRKQLVAGAARLIKSPLDVDTVGDRRTRAQVEGEGAGLFLLAPLSALGREERPLALIRGLVPGWVAADSEAACRLMEIDPASVEFHEVCQLDPEQPAAAGSAQDATGFLAEAAGIEALARAVVGRHQRTMIEVRRGDALVFTVIVDRQGTRTAARQTPILPLVLPLGHRGPREAPRPPAGAGGELESSATTAYPLDAWLTSCTEALGEFFAAQRAALALLGSRRGERAGGAPPTPAGVPLSATSERPNDLSVLRCLVRDVVLERPEFDENRRWTARLRVDEGHPFFFDHPLDHIPGILLVEGLEQLVEWVAAGSPAYIRHFTLRFHRFCEKQDPVTLCLYPEGSGRFTIQVVQKNELRAQGGLWIGALDTTDGPATRAEPLCVPRHQDRSQLHKQDAGNVMVTAPRLVGTGRFATDAVPPPPGHLLCGHGHQAWTTTYLVETARQALMLAGHGLLNIPQGVPMNLVALGVELDHPVLRGEPLSLECGTQSPLQLGGLLLADVKVDLQGPRGRVGAVQLKAQVVDQQTYEEQRWQGR